MKVQNILEHVKFLFLYVLSIVWRLRVQYFPMYAWVITKTPTKLQPTNTIEKIDFDDQEFKNNVFSGGRTIVNELMYNHGNFISYYRIGGKIITDNSGNRLFFSERKLIFCVNAKNTYEQFLKFLAMDVAKFGKNSQNIIKCIESASTKNLGWDDASLIARYAVNKTTSMISNIINRCAFLHAIHSPIVNNHQEYLKKENEYSRILEENIKRLKE